MHQVMEILVLNITLNHQVLQLLILAIMLTTKQAAIMHNHLLPLEATVLLSSVQAHLKVKGLASL